MPKLRTYQIEIFTGSDPANITNADGTEVREWLSSREEEEFLSLKVQSVGSELWMIFSYTEG